MISSSGIEDQALQPGKRAQNAYVDRFNQVSERGAERSPIESLAELRVLTDEWLPVHNRDRPYDSLGRVPPRTLLARPASAAQFPLGLSA